MKLCENLITLRTKNSLSQEKFAEMLGVSRKTVQNWEAGKSLPDVDVLVTLSKKFGISLDSLTSGNDTRVVHEHFEEILPTKDQFIWECYEKDLEIEYTQCLAEGMDIAAYEDLFKSVAAMPQSTYKKQLSDVIFKLIRSLGRVQGYEYDEPSDYEGICALRDGADIPLNVDKAALADKIKGAWTGRICGCLLGKPIEGIRAKDLKMLLKASDNYPMVRYIRSEDISDKVIEKSDFPLKRDSCWGDMVDCAPADDDINYTVMGCLLIEKYGRDFTPENVLELWTKLQPKDAYCTAERVAYMNYLNGYLPPNSALYKNPYREYIGAQIRADYFGYINPGNPEAAANMAFRDASISHIKNGIYGEMFVAAMLAAAFGTDDIEEVIKAGLSQIPQTSRLYKEVNIIVDMYKNGASQEDCRRKIREMYDEGTGYGWCHTNSNAMIVVMALLYNDGDYARSICAAVETAFDTDCNGATVGSIIGAIRGFDGIPSEWSAPISGKTHTHIFGFETVSLDEMTERTLKAIK